MKKLLFILSLIASMFTSMNAEAQCTRTSAFGSGTASGTCGSSVTLSSCNYATEYATIFSVVAGRTYRVNSSVGTDWVTVRHTTAAGTVVSFAVQGTSWVAPVSGTYYAHFSTNSSCGSNTSCRTTSVTTVAGCTPVVGCANTSSFGSATINTAGSLVTISTCSYAGEYSTISGAVSGQTLRFTSSVSSDYITVRSGSPTGPVVAQGTTPLTFSNTFTGTLYAHWNTNSSCGTQSTCRTTTVQCTSCTPPLAPNNDLVANATTILCGSTTSGTTVNATSTGTYEGTTTCGISQSQPGVWYKVTGNGQTMTASLCATSWDSKISVYSGTAANLTCIGGNDDAGPACSGLSASFTFPTVGGTTYWIKVHGFSSTSAFSLALNCTTPPPPYNPCSSVTNIASCGVSQNVNITAGNGIWSSFGGPFTTPGRENIFTYTPTVTGSYPITVTNNGSGWIDLFVKTTASGCNSSGWTYIDDVSGTATNNVTLTAGTTYYFLLDDEDISGSTGSITIGCPCIGQPVDGTYTYNGNFSISGTTVGACDDNALRAGFDRTYAVNISCAGSYTFSLCGSSFDTYLYLTNAVGSGVIAENDDFCSLQSQITATLAAGTYYLTVEGWLSSSVGAFTLNVSGTGSAPSITGSASNATCFGASNGSITATVNGNGNTATATLNGSSFNGSASGLAAGTYTLSASNCWGTSTQTFTVGQPAQLTASVVSNVANSEVCVGGGMTLTGSIGGDATVTYHWEQYDDFFGWSPITTDANVAAPATVTLELVDLTASANYQLVVTSATDANCATAGEHYVTVTEDPTLSISSSNVSCNGGNDGSAVADLSGGVAGVQYAYDWNNGLLNLSSSNALSGVAAGTYFVSATGTLGCDASGSVTITEPTLLTVNAGSDETVFYGYGPMECADLSASSNGGTGSVSYSWTSTASGGGMGSTLTACPTSNEVYTVTATDANGCQATDELSICVVDVHCEAGTSGIMKVEMCQVPPGNPGNAQTICIDASAVPAHLAIGCQLGACGELAAACSGSAAKSLETEELAAALVAYPNPTENTTTVSVTLTKGGNYSVEMFDMMGKLVKTVYAGSFEDYENLEFDVDMTNLQTGVYMISVSNGDQKIENIRVMKN